MRTIVAFVLASFLPVATSILPASTISNITTSPTSPAVRYFGDYATGDRVTWEFDYSVDVDARIHGEPWYDGARCPDYRASGSPLYPGGTSGSDTGYFRFEEPHQGATYVDAIRFRIYDSTHTTVLLEHFEPVDFAGKGEAWAKETFNKTQKRDAIKLQWAKDNGYILIYTRYDQMDEIEEIIESIFVSPS